MDTILTFFMSGDLATYATAGCVFVTGCTAITAITPTTVDDKVVNVLLKVLNFFAGNIGTNRNADE